MLQNLGQAFKELGIISHEEGGKIKLSSEGKEIGQARQEGDHVVIQLRLKDDIKFLSRGLARGHPTD